MRAVQIVQETGPDSALKLVELDEPEPSHMLTPGAGVVVEVHAAGVSFPEVLQTRGQYQMKPPLPFVPGSEVAGVVLSASDGASVKPGDRVAAFCALGGFAETAVAPEFFTFALPDALDFAQGASLILNYHTAYFSLAMRGRLKEGETVLVHGAAGGVGTAALQVAKGLGARTDRNRLHAREAARRRAGRRRRGGAAQRHVEGRGQGDQGGVDVVLDPVGGDRFTDSLRCLREDGRLVVVGFTGGSIPEVKVNRLLLGNTEVVGAGWGAYAMAKPQLNREIGAAVGEAHRRGLRAPDRRRALRAGDRRRRAARDRRAPRDRQGRARRARRLTGASPPDGATPPTGATPPNGEAQPALSRTSQPTSAGAGSVVSRKSSSTSTNC